MASPGDKCVPERGLTLRGKSQTDNAQRRSQGLGKGTGPEEGRVFWARGPGGG